MGGPPWVTLKGTGKSSVFKHLKNEELNQWSFRNVVKYAESKRAWERQHERMRAHTASWMGSYTKNKQRFLQYYKTRQESKKCVQMSRTLTSLMIQTGITVRSHYMKWTISTPLKHCWQVFKEPSKHFYLIISKTIINGALIQST